MTSEIQQLVTDITAAERKLKSLQAQLEARRRDCRHTWGSVIYDPIVKEAYTIPGDPPGTMGVDWRGPCHVPREEKPRWRRECSTCGDVEYTFDTKEKVEKIPVFLR